MLRLLCCDEVWVPRRRLLEDSTAMVTQEHLAERVLVHVVLPLVFFVLALQDILWRVITILVRLRLLLSDLGGLLYHIARVLLLPRLLPV